MADARQHVQRLLHDLVAAGRETGVQVAAHLHGELVVNAGADLADPRADRPVDDRTLFHSWSTGKGLTAAVVHVLADRGRLSYDTPIAEYWPEFAAHGKQGITLAHVLVHTAGVPQAPAVITPDDLRDWEGMCDRIARPGADVEVLAPADLCERLTDTMSRSAEEGLLGSWPSPR
ncbi:serine hydrolase domain-containing protein [Nonomuraea sp. NPDC049758]|uniref:serine hydrolase domain-containing protein n=1 Tax=Nonomuraea sp. NPDC049758 TaxID=3154360 RepID=UPI003444AA7E